MKIRIFEISDREKARILPQKKCQTFFSNVFKKFSIGCILTFKVSERSVQPSSLRQ